MSSTGEQANAVGEWWYLAPKVAFSRSGRLVAFSSDATNLLRRDRNHASDVFLHNRVRGWTRRVSVTSSGREANSLSFGPALSGDGRVVAFLSEATNMPGVNRRRPGRYVFIRDRSARRTVRVDVTSTGKPARGHAWAPPLISADGRYVAFTSDARNLAPGDEDTNADAFVRDLETGRTTGLSVGPNGNGDYEFSVASGMSADGRFVVLVSESPLAPGGPDDTSNVYLHDRSRGVTTWLGASGADIFDARAVSISDDGRVVAFVQRRDPIFGVVVWDASSGTTTCVSCWNHTGPATWDGLGGMSGDGRWIQFGRDDRPSTEVIRSVFLHDRVTGVNRRISVTANGGMPDADSGEVGLSPDGRFAAFASDASNLVLGDTNRRTDLFVRGPL